MAASVPDNADLAFVGLTLKRFGEGAFAGDALKESYASAHNVDATVTMIGAEAFPRIPTTMTGLAGFTTWHAMQALLTVTFTTRQIYKSPLNAFLKRMMWWQGASGEKRYFFVLEPVS